MDTFELNKIAGAILSALLVMTVIGFIGNALVSPPRLEKNVYVVAGVEQKPQETTAAAPAAVEPITPLLASANAQAGQAVAKQCASCHTFEKGGRNGVGPNLYGVVGDPKARVPGFNYSEALRAAAQKPGDEGKWTYEQLNAFLANPRAAIPGTRMAFAGLRKPEDRANLLAWLRTQDDNPEPLPQASSGTPPIGSERPPG